MNRETLTRALYLLLGIASIGNGIWLLVDPAGWNDTLRMALEDFGDGAINTHLLRKVGASYVGVSAAFFWCMVNTGVRRRVHLTLTLYFLLLAAIHVGEIGFAGVPSHRWITDAPLVFLPPVLLLLMMVPGGKPAPEPRQDARRPAAAARSPRTGAPAATKAQPLPLPAGLEEGTVKWFDAKKGFGFIVRANGDEIFVHYRAITGDGHRVLREGQRVGFRIGSGAKGPQAEDVVRLDPA